ncbi:MAG: hypothetical protein GC159_17675 [Phycisphaera sp.]|nr:hypothetical protein [Phycisphaera sp.]
MPSFQNDFDALIHKHFPSGSHRPYEVFLLRQFFEALWRRDPELSDEGPPEDVFTYLQRADRAELWGTVVTALYSLNRPVRERHE